MQLTNGSTGAPFAVVTGSYRELAPPNVIGTPTWAFLGTSNFQMTSDGQLSYVGVTNGVTCLVSVCVLWNTAQTAGFVLRRNGVVDLFTGYNVGNASGSIITNFPVTLDSNDFLSVYLRVFTSGGTTSIYTYMLSVLELPNP
jgi:hypothetical protein